LIDSEQVIVLDVNSTASFSIHSYLMLIRLKGLLLLIKNLEFWVRY